MTSILEFYEGKPLKLKNGEELTLQQILLKNNEWWDGCHDFIQWIFPTRTVSQYCADAPILTEEIAQELANKYEIQITCAYHRFVEFLDSQNMEEMNHNHLRITRMFESLTLISEKMGRDLQIVQLMKFMNDYLPLVVSEGIHVMKESITRKILSKQTAGYWIQAFYSKW